MAYDYVGGVVGNYLLLFVPPVVTIGVIFMSSVRDHISTNFHWYFFAWIVLQGILLILISSMLISYKGIIARGNIQQGACTGISMQEGESIRYIAMKGIESTAEDGRVQGIAMIFGLTISAYIALTVVTYNNDDYEHRLLGYVIGIILIILTFVQLSYVYNFYSVELYPEFQKYKKAYNTINYTLSYIQDKYKKNPDDTTLLDDYRNLIGKLARRISATQRLDNLDLGYQRFQNMPISEVFAYIDFNKDKDLLLDPINKTLSTDKKEYYKKEPARLKVDVTVLSDNKEFNPSESLNANARNLFFSLIVSLLIYAMILFHNFYRSSEIFFFIICIMIIFMTVTYICHMLAYA